jgi:hypothetical protein
MGDINSNILDARKTLRKLYEKYTKEFYDITLKIDKYLEGLEIKKEEEDENLER